MKECLKNLKKGNQIALKVIYDEYANPLFSFTRKFVKSNVLAEEIVHDVFLKLWQSRAGLKLECSFKSYLFTICRNHIINSLRRASMETSIEHEIVISYYEMHATPESELIYHDLKHVAENAISKLPPKRKLTFILNKQEGKSIDEIALELGISRGTVKDHVFKARKYIENCLAVDDGYFS
jgi:RNA polymerase sigma-70 factor (family 1)